MIIRNGNGMWLWQVIVVINQIRMEKAEKPNHEINKKPMVHWKLQQNTDTNWISSCSTKFAAAHNEQQGSKNKVPASTRSLEEAGTSTNSFAQSTSPSCTSSFDERQGINDKKFSDARCKSSTWVNKNKWNTWIGANINQRI